MKDTYIKIRLTQMEKDLIKERAEKINMTISDYVRYCCLIMPPKKLTMRNKK